MNYRDVARNTSIRNRFRCLSAIDQRKCDFLKKLSFTLLSRLHREEDPVWRECIIYKIKMLCGLSLGIRLDTYDNIPPPIRLSLLLENLTYPFCKEFLRFRKEDIHHFYVLLKWSRQEYQSNGIIWLLWCCSLTLATSASSKSWLLISSHIYM